MPNRYVCDVLKEIREAYKKRHYVLIPGLVEEAQTMVNRMESALADYKDIGYEEKHLSRLKKDRRKLEKEISELEDKLEGLKDE